MTDLRRIRLDLEHFIQDERRFAVISVSNEDKTVGDIVKKIQTVYDLEGDLGLFLDKFYLGLKDSLNVITTDDILVVKNVSEAAKALSRKRSSRLQNISIPDGSLSTHSACEDTSSSVISSYGKRRKKLKTSSEFKDNDLLCNSFASICTEEDIQLKKPKGKKILCSDSVTFIDQNFVGDFEKSYTERNENVGTDFEEVSNSRRSKHSKDGQNLSANVNKVKKTNLPIEVNECRFNKKKKKMIEVAGNTFDKDAREEALYRKDKRLKKFCVDAVTNDVNGDVDSVKFNPVKNENVLKTDNEQESYTETCKDPVERQSLKQKVKTSKKSGSAVELDDDHNISWIKEEVLETSVHSYDKPRKNKKKKDNSCKVEETSQSYGVESVISIKSEQLAVETEENENCCENKLSEITSMDQSKNTGENFEIETDEVEIVLDSVSENESVSKPEICNSSGKSWIRRRRKRNRKNRKKLGEEACFKLPEGDITFQNILHTGKLENTHVRFDNEYKENISDPPVLNMDLIDENFHSTPVRSSRGQDFGVSEDKCTRKVELAVTQDTSSLESGLKSLLELHRESGGPVVFERKTSSSHTLPKISFKETHLEPSLYPIMESTPKENDVLMFKVLRLDENYSPEMSNYIVGRVMSYSPSTNEVKFNILMGGNECAMPKGKFHIEFLDDSEEDTEIAAEILELKWPDLIEPRLLYIGE